MHIHRYDKPVPWARGRLNGGILMIKFRSECRTCGKPRYRWRTAHYIP